MELPAPSCKMENEKTTNDASEAENRPARRHDEIDVPKKTGLFAKIAIFLIFVFPLVCFILMCKYMKWL